MEFRKMVTITLYAKQKKGHRCIEQTFGLWEKARVGCSERTALKQVYYQGWNRSPAQVGCMRQVLGPGALGRPRGSGWRGRWAGGSGWGTHVNPWLIHVNVWQNPLQCCKVISLQLIKINEKKKVKKKSFPEVLHSKYYIFYVSVINKTFSSIASLAGHFMYIRRPAFYVLLPC